MNKKGSKLPIILLLGMIILSFSIYKHTHSTVDYTYEQFERALDNGEVTEVVIQPTSDSSTAMVKLALKTGARAQFNVTDVAGLEQELKIKFPTYVVKEAPAANWFLESLLPILILGVVMYFIMMLVTGQASAGNAKMANFGKNHAKLSEGDNGFNFSCVAGLEEEKEDLEEIVDFLRKPKKYTELGARIPKGVLLEGPPGTGKTLLAKAIAGEAAVPFFSISGSDFVEMFVGVGASRVRDLFEDAKKHAPCIVFIDEIDAVARRRGTGMGGGHDEREQTLNQLLVEMDGFGVNSGIIVMAATNRVDILDPAILRPGRFDRKIRVGSPDVKGRKAILEVHSKNKPLSEDVDLDQIARTTAGLAGADLENLMNESAIQAARNNRKFITMQDIRQSFIKIGVGAEKKSKVITDKDKMITAYHEVGHAILFHVLEGVGPVYLISIIPTGPGALGYTMPLPEKDDVHVTRGAMMNHIMVSLGGRIAEQLTFNDYTGGAAQDIKDATRIARNMVVKYGMSDRLGMICYADDDDEVFIGRDLAHTKSVSEATAAAIDDEVRRIVAECYKKAREVLIKHSDILSSAAAYLMENEKMTRETFEALFASADS